MASQISSIGTETGAIRESAIELFGGLSHEQINWKPSEEVWSNGQILDHLKTTNESGDMGSAVIASPVSEMVTLRVKDALEIIVLHERRHFAQATRLMDSAMFPV